MLFRVVLHARRNDPLDLLSRHPTLQHCSLQVVLRSEFLCLVPKAANDRRDWNEAAHDDWELRSVY